MTEEEYLIAKNNIDEEWKQLVLNGEYQKYDISNTGRIRNHETHREYKLRKPFGTYDMYTPVTLTLNDGTTYQNYIHRLVGIMFIPIPKKYIKNNISIEDLDIDHIDNIRCHNIVSNLQWLTHKENMTKMFNTSSYINSLRPADKEIKDICQMLEDGYLIYEIAKKYNYSESLIYKIRYGMHSKKISKKFTFKPLSDNFDENIYNKMKNMLLEGESKLKISIIFNTTVDVVEKIQNDVSFEEINNYRIHKDSRISENNKQSNELIIKICEMLQSGMSPKRVSDVLNIPKSTIQHIASRETHTDISSKYIFDYDRCKVPDYKIKKVCELIKENKMPLVEIAKKVGVSYSFAKSIKRKKHRTDISCNYF